MIQTPVDQAIDDIGEAWKPSDDHNNLLVVIPDYEAKHTNGDNINLKHMQSMNAILVMIKARC